MVVRHAEEMGGGLMETALEAAHRELERGRQPIPVPYRQKFPRVQGWQRLILGEVDLPAHFNGHSQNLGILNGVPSHNQVDVDLDCREALLLASNRLPPTSSVFGRSSKPSSHRLYRCDPLPPTTRFQDLDGTMLVEFRATGTQTIFPPSTHPTGEKVTWDDDGHPAMVDGYVLLAEVSRLAAACLLGRHWPSQGSRQDAALALAGALIRAGWTEEDTGRYIRDVAAAAGDEETAKRATAAEYTRRRLDRHQSATGWPRLAQLLGSEVVDQVRQWFGVQDQKPSEADEGDNEESGRRNGRPSQATVLVALATSEDIEYFHDPDGEAYASLPVHGHRETWSLRSKRFRIWLAGRYHSEQGTTPGGQALTDAIGILQGRAVFDGPEHVVHVRIAEQDGIVYLDLGNAAWEVVRIGPDGWEVVHGHHAPMTFRRSKGLGALPAPVCGGSLSVLRRFVNVANDEDWRLMVAWLVAALRPTGPYPILVLSGEQGSAKSTTARVVRALVDPHRLELRAEPRDQRDLAIAAANSWVIAFDNLSAIPTWLSDALCRLATGGGFATRELYTDAEEALFDAKRPVLLTGIEEVVTRGDLVDRALPLALPTIAPEHRRTEREFWRGFEAAHPAILGALLDAVSVALANWESTELSWHPRMADFAQWAEAAAPALGWARGDFLRAYAGNRDAANDIALEALPVASALRSFVDDHERWRGTATELLQELSLRVTEGVQRDRSWPKRANSLVGQLKRLAPNLRHVGIEVATGIREAGGKRRIIEIRARQM